ncbi:MAG TPA: hypothetical protein VNT30_03515 [Stellaceae bacterium]|nr:hypothetical protein [Stellaceae bacterium]
MSTLIFAAGWLAAGLLMVIIGSGMLSRVRTLGFVILTLGIASGGAGLALIKHGPPTSYGPAVTMIFPAQAAVAASSISPMKLIAQQGVR